MKCLIIFLLLATSLNAQEVGDSDYVFTSLNKAMETPELVYNLTLEKQKLQEFPEAIFQFKNLKVLSLRKNRISQIPVDIEKLTELIELNLAQNKIYLLPPQLGKLDQLQFLYLAKNDVEKVPAFFKDLKQLQKLDLWLNNVKEIDEAIHELKQLKEIDLRGMMINDEVLRALKTELPDTQIFFSNDCDCGI